MLYLMWCATVNTVFILIQINIKYTIDEMLLILDIVAVPYQSIHENIVILYLFFSS